MAKKFLSLERLAEYNELIKEKIDTGDSSVKSYVDTEVAKKANSSHTHDDRYYTETEVDAKLETKQDKNLIITVTATTTDGTTTYTTDKTYAEILQSYNDGTNLIVTYKGAYYNLVSYYYNIFTFSIPSVFANKVIEQRVSISASNVSVVTYELVTGLASNLTTDSKVIVDAINEVHSELNSHNHDDLYYTQYEIDAMEFITTDDIDTICGGITEEGLPLSDVDELMAQLEDV